MSEDRNVPKQALEWAMKWRGVAQDIAADGVERTAITEAQASSLATILEALVDRIYELETVFDDEQAHWHELVKECPTCPLHGDPCRLHEYIWVGKRLADYGRLRSVVQGIASTGCLLSPVAPCGQRGDTLLCAACSCQEALSHKGDDGVT